MNDLKTEPEILYQDSHYIGFFKPPHVPTAYGEWPCFIEEVRQQFPELFSFSGFKKEEGGLLYRLDNETSGLLLFAKNREAFDRFTNDTALKKIYLARVSCLPDDSEKKRTIDYPLVHKSSKRMTALIPGRKIDYRGKPQEAVTECEWLKDGFVRCFIGAGARHQIRVHLASVGYPIVGDSLYHGIPSDELHLCCVGISSPGRPPIYIDLKGLLEKQVQWLNKKD